MAGKSFLIQYIGFAPPNPKSAKMCMKFNFIYIQWDKFELCAMLLSNNLFFVYSWLSFGYHSPLYPIILYVQVSLSMNIIVYLETYTYERGHLLFWYPTFFQATLSLIYNSLVAPSLSRECLSYFYSHLCALTLYWRFFSSCSSRWVCWFCWLNVLTCPLFFFNWL